MDAAVGLLDADVAGADDEERASRVALAHERLAGRVALEPRVAGEVRTCSSVSGRNVSTLRRASKLSTRRLSRRSSSRVSGTWRRATSRCGNGIARPARRRAYQARERAASRTAADAREVAGPEAEVVLDGRVGEARDEDLDGRSRRDALRAGDRRLEDGLHLGRGVGVRDVDRGVEHHRGAGARVVDDVFPGDAGVREDDVVAVARAERDRPPVHLDDLALLVAHADPLPRGDRALHLERDARHEAREDVLQREAEDGREDGRRDEEAGEVEGVEDLQEREGDAGQDERR